MIQQTGWTYGAIINYILAHARNGTFTDKYTCPTNINSILFKNVLFTYRYDTTHRETTTINMNTYYLYR